MSGGLVTMQRPAPAIAAVSLNRPDKRNALNAALLRELVASLEQCDQDPLCRVIVLHGAGNVFCAGMDLQEAASQQDGASPLADGIQRALELLHGSRCVTIAAAHGAALGGGGGLLAACDLAIAAENLRIAFPETRRGLVPALVSIPLVRKLTDGALRELFLVGEPISATRALEMGLVQRVVPSEQLLQQAVALAGQVALGGPEAVRFTKQLLNYPAAGFESLHTLHEQVRQSGEAIEGLAAFREGRPPRWVSHPEET